MTHRLSTLSALLLLALLPGCELFGGGGRTVETDEAREKWAAFQEGDYSFVVTRGCFCMHAGTFWIQVVDGEISIVQRVADHEYLPEDQFEVFPTIEDLFDLIDRALRESADEVSYAFDPNAGYPTSISIDWIKPAVDDELSYSVMSAVPGITNPD